MDELFKTIVNAITQKEGVFAILFMGLSILVARVIWVFYNKIIDNAEKTITNLTTNNTKNADSAEEMVKSSNKVVEYFKLLNDKEEVSNLQIKQIKKLIQKGIPINIELIGIIKVLLKDNPEALLRLDNLIKELQRPIDD